jgi:hypothetical protein
MRSLLETAGRVAPLIPHESSGRLYVPSWSSAVAPPSWSRLIDTSQAHVCAAAGNGRSATVHIVRSSVAHLFGIDPERIRVEIEAMSFPLPDSEGGSGFARMSARRFRSLRSAN